MCAIYGMIWNEAPDEMFRVLHQLQLNSIERGRDGHGLFHKSRDTIGYLHQRNDSAFIPEQGKPGWNMVIGNRRAEPTTEWVKDKKITDQQPYQAGRWVIVHNGTIANDKELRTYTVDTKIDSAAIAEYLDARNADDLLGLISTIVGSYAILAFDTFKNRLHVACNYRPIWFSRIKENTILFGSTRRSVVGGIPQMMQPYSYSVFDMRGKLLSFTPLQNTPIKNRSLVVCSSGLDSTVALAWCIARGDDVAILHYCYGSRAQGREVDRIYKIGEFYNIPVIVKKLNIYDQEDSNLLNPVADIAGGEAGAEYAHEWVPARNLVMLSLATAYAEAKGYNRIILGNNLEEAGAYPDNEPEFIDRLNDVMPFAVGDGANVRIEMPVGNMMKHEIVALGLELKAPLHLTWSCYKNHTLHCGVCGPCVMRRTAFDINAVEEVIEYETPID